MLFHKCPVESCIHKHACTHTYNYIGELLLYRKAQRIVHIPFFEPLPVEDEARQIHIEDSYHACRKAASSSIGFMISLKEGLLSSTSRMYIGEYLLPFVSCNMPNVHHCAKKSYALVILAAKLVGCY